MKMSANASSNSDDWAELETALRSADCFIDQPTKNLAKVGTIIEQRELPVYTSDWDDADLVTPRLNMRQVEKEDDIWRALRDHQPVGFMAAKRMKEESRLHDYSDIE